VAGLEVRRDAEVVRSAQWGTGVAVDPGRHALAASAPGMAPWQTGVDAVAEGKTVSVDVPPLTPIPVAAPTPETAPPPLASSPPAPSEAPSTDAGSSSARPGHGQRIAALLVGGVGVVGLGVGSVFGIEALSKHSDYVPHCPNNVCDPTGLQLHNDAASDATVSTVAMIAGAAALAGGVVLWLTAPSPAESPRTGLRLEPSIGGLSLEGAW
jgi:hypothetical protein